MKLLFLLSTLVVALALTVSATDPAECFSVHSAFKLPGQDYNVNTGDGFSFWINEWNANDCGGNLGDYNTKNDFQFITSGGLPTVGTFTQYEDHATLKGLIAHVLDSRFRFLVDITFSSRYNPGDPGYDLICPYNDFWTKNAAGVREGRLWAYGNATSWVYYLSFSGTLTGVGALGGYQISIGAINSLMAGDPAACRDGRSIVGFQCGVMANGKNVNFGCSGWYTRLLTFNGVVVTDGATPAGQPSLCRLKPTTTHGDINIDLTPCVFNCTEQLKTFTIGGWGAKCAGNNPGCYLKNNYAAAFPTGAKIGCAGCTYTFADSEAVRTFIRESRGPSTPLYPCNVVVTAANAASLAGGTVAAQALGVTLAVGFDLYDPNFGASNFNLIDGLYSGSESACNNQTVGGVLNIANSYLGGCDTSAPDVISCLDAINNNFDGGNVNNGLVCFQT